MNLNRIVKTSVVYFFALVLFSLNGCAVFNNDGGVVVYGEDDRVEYYQINNPQVLQNANAVGALVNADMLKSTREGYQLKSHGTLEDFNRLAPNQRFAKQPVSAFCTVFLIDTNKIATAGHCVLKNRDDLNNLRVVFKFRYNSVNNLNQIFDQNKVFKVKRIISMAYRDSSGLDYAILELDRHVQDPSILPLKLASRDAVEGDAVSVMGHPNGIPFKYADNAKVVGTSKNLLEMDIDTFSGNSGSPIFNSQNEVVGILVSGERDYDYTSRGREVRIINNRYSWQSEKATKLSVWKDKLNN